MNSFRIEGPIGEGAATAAELSDFLTRHRGRAVEIIINSGGGSATEGAALLSEIEAHGRVIVKIRGIAASAASLAAMGGAEIHMHPAAAFMIHDPAAHASGTAAALERTARTLAGLGRTYAESYAKRSGLPIDQIETMMAQETWVDAEQALALGFIDRIEATTGPDPVPALAANFTQFKHPPSQLVALATSQGFSCKTGTKGQAMLDTDKTETGGFNMTAKQAKNLYALAEIGKVPTAKVGEILSTAKDFEAAMNALTEAWAGQSDQRVIMAPSNADWAQYDATRAIVSVGEDWSAGRGLAKKQADALATLTCQRLGLTHEPTMGREFLAEDAERTKARMAHATGLAAGERGLSDREAFKLFMSGTTSTSDYPTIAASAIEVVVGRSMEQSPIALRQATHDILASDWRDRNHWSLSGANVMQTVGEGGEPAFLTIDEKGEAISAPARKAGFWRATEELIRNAARSTDIEVALARAMIESGNETLRSVIADKIITPGNLSDGIAVFDATRGNLAEAGANITVTSVSAARVGLSRMVDSTGTRRPVEGTLLLVAPEQLTEAEQIAADIAAAQVDQVNPFSGRVTVISDPGLTGDAWYMLGAPGRYDGLALILMDDMQTPMIEAQSSWTSFGMEWRAQWPMACSWVRPSWFKTDFPSG